MKANEESLFVQALEIDDPAERAAFLERACAGEPTLRNNLESLLSAYDSGAFLERPAALSDRAVEQALAAGTVIGPYRLLETIGEGGFGVVFAAEQTEPLRRSVALKVLKPGMDSAQVLARFEAERQALALMDHPSIARVLDGGATASGRPYFVMELIRGVPITDYCDTHRLPIRQRLELFVHVCQAVQHAHQKGVIHRDLKPSNVLVTLHDGVPVPKVIDFGIAKALQQPLTEQPPITGQAQLIGTPLYMSPEQASLGGADVDTRSDVYSLGVLLYELLTGTTPFERERLNRLGLDEFRRILREEEPPRPSRRAGPLRPDGELDWIVLRCLEKDRERRYASASALAADVLRYLADEPVEAGPPSARYRMRKFLRRHRGPVLAAVIVLLALLAGLGGTAGGLVEARRQRDDAEEARGIAAGRLDELKQEKKKTDEEAAVARTVSLFLQQLLAQADVANQPLPGGGVERNPDITVGELFERAAQAIEGKFTNQPLTEAALRMTIGATLRSLGRHAEARPHLERAVRLRTAQQGPRHFDTLVCKCHLALLHLLQGDYERAEPLFHEVHDGCAADRGPADPATLTAKNNLALLYQEQGRYDEAEQFYREVITVQTTSLGPDHSDTLSSRNGLALLYQVQGKVDQSERLFKDVLSVREKRLGKDHPDLLSSKNSMGCLYKVRRQFERARPLLEEVLAARRVKPGADHPDTLSTQNDLGLVHQGLKQYDRAETLLEEVHTLTVARLGKSHPRSLTIKDNLAMLYQDWGKLDRAEPLYRDVLAGRLARRGARHHETLKVKHRLALLYRAQGKHDQAEPLWKDLVDAHTRQFGADHPHTLTGKNNLAAGYWSMRRFDLSVPLLEECLAGRRKRLGVEDSNTIMTAINLAVNYRDAGRPTEALRLIEEWLPRGRAKLGLHHPTALFALQSALSIYQRAERADKAERVLWDLAEVWKRKSGLESPELAQVHATLGYHYLQRKKGPAAERVLRAALGVRRRRDPDAWTTFNTQSLLGGALLLQGRRAEAEPLLLAGGEGVWRRASQIPAQGRIYLSEALERIVRHYDARNDPARAQPWRQRLAELRSAGAKPRP